jgi:hypothetical protein
MNCSQLYVGATRPLHELSSEFIVVEPLGLKDEGRDAVAGVLEVPNVYYLASHAGCGCGWEYLGVDTDWDKRNLASRNALEAYLRSEVVSGPVLLMSVNVDALGSTALAWDRKTMSELMSDFDGWRVPYGTNAVRVASLVHDT